MQHRRALPLLLLGAVVLLGCQARAPAFTAQDEATIRTEMDSALAAINAGNWGAWASLFSDDAIVQPPHAPTVSGRAAIEDWGKQALVFESMTWPNVQVHGDGDMAWATTDYELQLPDGAADHGKQIAVYQRQADGEWKVVGVSYNSDVPLPATAAP